MAATWPDTTQLTVAHSCATATAVIVLRDVAEPLQVQHGRLISIQHTTSQQVGSSPPVQLLLRAPHNTLAAAAAAA